MASGSQNNTSFQAQKWTNLRAFTIGATGKDVNGSANVSWSMNEIMGSSDSSKFYRGDKTWSNTLTGDFTVNGLINNYKFSTQSSLNADDVRATNGFWIINAGITNAPTTNHGLLLGVATVGTPYQMFFADNQLYVYKRWYTSGAWNTWQKMSAGYADSAGSCTGNAATATTWQTARTLTIGATGKSVNGSSNVSWSKAEIIGSGTTAQFLRGDHTWTNSLANYIFNTTDIPSGAANMNSAATANTMTFHRNGILIPNPGTVNDGGFIRVKGSGESDTILELSTWDDSGSGETIQFNYYPTNSQITPTYSVSVPKASGTLCLTNGTGASGTWGISITGNADTVDNYHASSFFIHDREAATGTSGTDGLWGVNGSRSYHNALPDGLSGVYNYGQVISFSTDNSARFQIYASHVGSDSQSIYFRTGWGSDKKAWRTILHSNNWSSYCAAASHTHPISQVTWANGQNLACTGGGEWSVDMSGDGYWHVWSGTEGRSTLICYNSNSYVAVPIHLYVGGYNNTSYGLSASTIACNGNLWVSANNATGGGIILADDGDIVDLNDGYCSMRFSAGVRIYSGNRGGSANITLRNDGWFICRGMESNGAININGASNLDIGANSSNDQGDIVWWHNNGRESARLWTGQGFTQAAGPYWRCLKPDTTLLYSGNLLCGAGSSRTIKHNIYDLVEREAMKVLQLRPVFFEYNTGCGPTGLRTGMIAEEVLPIIPQVTYDLPMYEDPNNVSTPTRVVKAINYELVLPYVIKLVQMQQKEIENLKQTINQLQNNL